MRSAERPIFAMVQDIVSNVQTLVRAEIRLARTEIAEELDEARAAGILFAAGAVAALLSLAFLLASVMFALRLVMPSWAAALIVGLGAAGAAAICLVLGGKRFKTVQTLPKTAASLKENVQWARHPTR